MKEYWMLYLILEADLHFKSLKNNKISNARLLAKEKE
jgi:hypothetical protein